MRITRLTICSSAQVVALLKFEFLSQPTKGFVSRINHSFREGLGELERLKNRARSQWNQQPQMNEAWGYLYPKSKTSRFLAVGGPVLPVEDRYYRPSNSSHEQTCGTAVPPVLPDPHRYYRSWTGTTDQRPAPPANGNSPAKKTNTGRVRYGYRTRPVSPA
jgi:hypothetical protein